MIKVCHVITDTNIGGAGRWLINLFKNINRSQYDIMLILPFNSQLKRLIETLDVPVIELENMSNESIDLKIVRELYRIFKENKVEIVHTHASFSARLASKLAGVRVVNTKHCLEEVSNNQIKNKLKAFLSNQLSDKVIAISEAVKTNLLNQGIQGNKIELVYNGVEPLKSLDEDEKRAIRKQYSIPEEVIIVGNVARLEEIKGQKYFIQAAHQLYKTNPNVVFLIIGTGSDEEDLKQLVRQLGLSNYVLFLGYIKDIDNIMNIIDINVISSLSEALCLSLIEGMSLSIPGIGTDSGGVNEVIKHNINGFVVPTGDSKALAEAISTLLHNKTLRVEMGIKGKEIAGERFMATTMTNQIQVMYDTLINKSVK